jgi:hypothetical protein
VQGEVVTAQDALSDFSVVPFAITALLVFALFTLPWCWYFFLRRVRELSDAIKGK